MINKDEKKQYNFELFAITQGGMIGSVWIGTDVNLLEMYKAAKVSGANEITWEKGCLSLYSIIGIMDRSVN